MKRRPSVLAIVIALNLVALVGLAFAFPHLMVSPGPLVQGHAEITTDCFACHAAWRGASSARCVECHRVDDIGLRTTRGIPVAAAKTIKASFHQQLIEGDCVACHGGHEGTKPTRRSRKPFAHDLLKADSRERCGSCHAAPAGDFHAELKAECGTCHRTQAWKPASFDHAQLAAVALEHCEGCHRAPKDRLHAPISGGCKACHSTQAWTPATFDHDRHFVLDRDHNVDCTTCHPGSDFSRYTCYGCHEHTQAKVRAEHLEEGIRNFENCVECHRSAEGEPRGRGSRERD